MSFFLILLSFVFNLNASTSPLNFELIPPPGWKFRPANEEALKSGILGQTLIGTIVPDPGKKTMADLLRIHVHARSLSTGMYEKQITQFIDELGPSASKGGFKVTSETTSFGTFRNSRYRVLDTSDKSSALTVVVLGFSGNGRIIGVKAVIKGSGKSASAAVDAIRLMLLGLRVKSKSI